MIQMTSGLFTTYNEYASYCIDLYNYSSVRFILAYGRDLSLRPPH
jgi:hypothetical protein